MKEHEGFRSEIYLDHLGNRTIGYGTNLEDGIDKHEAAAMLRARILQNELQVMDHAQDNGRWYMGLNPARRAVVLDMAYQLGVRGFLKFEKTIMYLGQCDWEDAAREMLDSKWARQTPERAKALAQIMRDGYRKVS